jgi:hypothetical protein
MKKFLLASVVALVGLGIVTPVSLLAQGSDSITIKDPAEYNAYNNAITQTDARAKASACESFLQTYPQSIVKKSVLDALLDADSTIDPAKALDAASRLLQVDPGNLKALYMTVVLKKQQAGGAQGAAQAQLLDDAAAAAQQGLAATKPAGVTDADFAKQKSAITPFFHSAIAVDDIYSKKDLKGAIAEFRTELELIAASNPDGTKSGPALNDTLTLGQTYTKLDPPDMKNAVWFLARAESYAPASYQPVIHKQAAYWYKRFHGSADGYDDIKALAAATVFPAGEIAIKAADTPTDIANKYVTDNPDFATYPLGDTEFVLANASTENAEKVFASLKDKNIMVPGVVIAATASQIQLAVTDDAKTDKKADFTINMKEPLADADIPAVGATVANLAGTFDSYTQSPAQIIMRDGAIQKEEKKKPVAKKPAAGHHTAH